MRWGTFERALMQSMSDPHNRVPPSMVHWVVTGDWPRPSPRFDVSYPRGDLARLLDI